MNDRIASLLKDRIAELSYVDRIAGLVRLVKHERGGDVVAIPVALDAEADYACEEGTLQDMVPDERYGCMVYFEDRGVVRTTSRTRGVSFTSRVRLVCWVNTQKFGSDPSAASKIQAQFISAIRSGPYNSGPFIGLRHDVEAIPQTGHSLFSAYTYPEAVRQYLMPPFDAFAIDIATTLRIKAGCEDEVTAEDDACWTPPTTRRRRNPKDFTCEELQDPDTGLTAEQLGPECLDCGTASGPGCTDMDITVNVNGSFVETMSVDPCVNNTLNITIA